jgi:hypothetical protein
MDAKTLGQQTVNVIGPEGAFGNDFAGLTKREAFAMAALQGIMANPVRWQQIADDYNSGKKTYKQCSQANAVKAVSLADALLAELAKEQTP